MAADEARRGIFGLRMSAPSRRDVEAGLAPPGAAGPDLSTLRVNARALAAACLQPSVAEPMLQRIDLGSRAPSLADIAAPWFGYWARELSCTAQPQRKLWEMVAVLQAFYEAGVLKPKARVLGFGVGDEPLPSYLASIGLKVVASDLDGQAETERFLNRHLVEESVFNRQVEVSNIDIQRLDDPTLRGFDGCWSCGVINTLDAAYAAEEAVISAMETLRPGGVAVHLTEFAFAAETSLEQPGNMLFSAAFLENLARGLAGRGHAVAPLSFALGDHPLDAYIDEQTPSAIERVLEPVWETSRAPPHLKTLVDGVPATSFALIVRRRP